jgi:hypothetical protein
MRGGPALRAIRGRSKQGDSGRRRGGSLTISSSWQCDTGQLQWPTSSPTDRASSVSSGDTRVGLRNRASLPFHPLSRRGHSRGWARSSLGVSAGARRAAQPPLTARHRGPPARDALRGACSTTRAGRRLRALMQIAPKQRNGIVGAAGLRRLPVSLFRAGPGSRWVSRPSRCRRAWGRGHPSDSCRFDPLPLLVGALTVGPVEVLPARCSTRPGPALASPRVSRRAPWGVAFIVQFITRMGAAIHSMETCAAMTFQP